MKTPAKKTIRKGGRKEIEYDLAKLSLPKQIPDAHRSGDSMNMEIYNHVGTRGVQRRKMLGVSGG